MNREHTLYNFNLLIQCNLFSYTVCDLTQWVCHMDLKRFISVLYIFWILVPYWICGLQILSGKLFKRNLPQMYLSTQGCKERKKQVWYRKRKKEMKEGRKTSTVLLPIQKLRNMSVPTRAASLQSQECLQDAWMDSGQQQNNQKVRRQEDGKEWKHFFFQQEKTKAFKNAKKK